MTKKVNSLCQISGQAKGMDLCSYTYFAGIYSLTKSGENFKNGK